MASLKVKEEEEEEGNLNPTCEEDEEESEDSSGTQEDVDVVVAKNSTWRQLLAVFVVYHFALSLGASSGFSAVAIPSLQEGGGDEQISLSKDQLSWFASLPTLTMIPCNILGGLLGQWLGSRMALTLIAPLFSAGFICQAAAGDVAMLLFGRMVAGAAAGMACGPTATYVSEVTTPNLRTTLNAGISGAYNLGMLCVFALGASLRDISGGWRILAGTSAALPLVGMAGLAFWAPESPAWLVTRGRDLEAKEALVRLRGHSVDVEEELKVLKKSYADVLVTRKEISQEKENRKSIGRRITSKLKIFLRRDVWLPLLIFEVITLLQQFSGLSSISYYAVSVFVQSGSSIDEYLATILYGVVRFISQIIGCFLLIRFPRRKLLFVSSLLVSLGMSLLGTSAYLTSKEETESSSILGFLPLFSVLLVAFAYHIGLGPIPWSFTAELFPVDVRPFMSGVTNCTSSLYIFLVVKTFPALAESLTLAGTYWLYSGSALLAVIFTFAFVPETKGKRLDQITEEFAKSNKDKTNTIDSSIETEQEEEKNIL